MGVGLKEWQNTSATTTFISYLFNLEPESLKKGSYKSNYWTSLTNLMHDKKYPSNWIHIYIKDTLVPNAIIARSLIKKFNAKNNGREVHVTLASFLSLKIIFNTLKDWIKVNKANKYIGTKIKAHCDYLWPLLVKDYNDSFTGIPAINNLVYFNLFESAMSNLPVQKKGCYLQENISWEFSLISNWKSFGHKANLIGFPHASIIYWDLRNFFDRRIYCSKDKANLPLPDFIGMNGDAAKNMYLSGDYPVNDLIDLESLRYLYLSNFSHSRVKEFSSSNDSKVVLVVGDYLKENTYKQLEMLSSALTGIHKSVHFIIKPHPAGQITLEKYSNLQFELSYKPMEDLLKISDIVYSSLITSAAVDAYCANLPIITFLDGNTLNMSPLRGVKGVYFVRNSEELSVAINSIDVTETNLEENYFYLDQKLPRWSQWLDEDLIKINKV